MRKRISIILFVVAFMLIGSAIYIKVSQSVRANQLSKNPIVKEIALEKHPKSNDGKKYYLGKAMVENKEMYYFIDKNDNGDLRFNPINTDSKINFIKNTETPKVVITNDKSYELYIPQDSIFENCDLYINNKMEGENE